MKAHNAYFEINYSIDFNVDYNTRNRKYFLCKAFISEISKFKRKAYYRQYI